MRNARVLWGLAVAALLGVLTLALWPTGEGEDAPRAASSTGSAPPSTPARPSPPPEPPPPARDPLSPAPAVDVLSAALHEERVTLASRVVIEGIDRDRPWVCAGESLGLSARLGGEHEPGAVYRWVWLTVGGEAELHPGPMLQWRAPTAAGRYRVRFQVCKDLGGRRVGVLAEREVEVDVRSCGKGERQEDASLRLDVVQRGHGAFAFQALYAGSERIETYAWDFGDGTRATTTEPQSEHTYSSQGLGPHESKSFTVRLTVRLPRGDTLQATAFALTRGQPPADEPPPVQLEVSRWRPRSDGSGWQSDLVVRPSEEVDVTWDRVERITQYWDGRADIDTRKWSDAIRVEEDLERGGFRGHVTVSPSEVPADVKQLLDFLYGRDATGQEVVVSWSPFKREAPPPPPESADRHPAK